MMKIDTTGLVGWHHKTVVLEFEHGPIGNDGSRCTEMRLVEFTSEVHAADRNTGWKQVPGGWKRTIRNETARCSPKDQFCKETGRRVALARLAGRHGVGFHVGFHPIVIDKLSRSPLNPLVAAAIYQYYTRRRRK